MSETNGSRSRDNDVTLPPPSDGGVSVSSSHPGGTQEEVIHAGKRIGKYLIRRLIGRGGMGAVYEAMDVPLQRKVALKILPREFSQNEEALKRFIREAQLAARLNHPNVVTVFDVGRKGTIYFIAMELVLGTSGQELLEAGKKIDWREAARAITDVCRALAAAHEAGLLHRDIKPGNILWSQTGEVKLSDFGLAKPTQTTQELSITRRDAFIGTPLFMSPEQCRNDGVDLRSDIYSLGATFYTFLTGQAPYNQGSAIQILFAHCSAPIPDVRDTIPDVPQLCTYIVHKAMAKNPADRYQSAREMRHDLEALLGGLAIEGAGDALALGGIEALASGEIVEPPPVLFEPAYRKKSRPPLLLIGAGIAAVLALAIVIGVLSMQSTPEPQPLAQSDAPAPAMVTRVLPVLPVTPPKMEQVFAPVLSAQPPPTAPVEPAPVTLNTTLTVAGAPASAPRDDSPIGPGLIPPASLVQEFSTPTPAPEHRRPHGSGGPNNGTPENAPQPPDQQPDQQPDARPEPRNPPPNDRQPAGVDDEHDLQGLTLAEIRDPLLRQYARAKRFAAGSKINNDEASIEVAAQALVLWSDFLREAPLPLHRKWANDAKQMAEKLKPGIDKIKPRVTPADPSAILPPPDHSRPGGPEASPNDDKPNRPQPPQRRPNGPRRD